MKPWRKNQFLIRTLRLHCGVCVFSFVAISGVSLIAQDWPQFLGPGRDGVYEGPALAREWAGESPREAWRRSIGEGFAGPVVAKGRVLLFHRVAGEEVLEAFMADTGEPVWRYAYPTNYRDDFGFDEGPRSSPVVDAGRVFTFGAQGQLHAVDLETGAGLWNVDTRAQFRFSKAFFGAAGTPLVEGGRVLANIGGQNGAGIVAFSASTGDVLWTSTNEEASYSSPVVATFGGVRHAVFFTRDNLIALDPATGRIRFERSWRARIRASVNAATPLVVDDHLFISAQYGTGAGVFRIAGLDLEEVWASDDVLSNHYATSVYHDGYLYGYHGRQEYGPSFRAVAFDSGEVVWDTGQFGAGSVTVAGQLLVIMKESGELVLADASPDGFVPVATAQLLPPTVRAYPAIADGHLFVRNDDTLLAVDLMR
jgi:outer membrane protein assembly factor BamB|tara:strand:+ start:2625 stop:3896 length:1272 start_codon:yes stop_codon:yes gene_type:complete